MLALLVLILNALTHYDINIVSPDRCVLASENSPPPPKSQCVYIFFTDNVRNVSFSIERAWVEIVRGLIQVHI